MELQIKDRLYIPTFLSPKGNFKQFNLKKEILRKIEISENERQVVGLTENAETKRIEWDITKDTPLSIEFSADELTYLKESCEKLSDQELQDDMWQCIEKIYGAINE